MIESGIFTKSTVFTLGEGDAEEVDLNEPSTPVIKETMYHLVHSHIYQIFTDAGIDRLLKQKLIYEFGFKLGFNLAEEECMGYVKASFAKDAKKETTEAREFVGQMRVLNSRVWHVLIGSKGKLFSIGSEKRTEESKGERKGANYNIEDKVFTLGKCFQKLTDPKSRQYFKLLKQFCEGIVRGTLDKFQIQGDITINEDNERNINVCLRSLVKKEALNTFSEYSAKIIKENTFLM